MASEHKDQVMPFRLPWSDRQELRDALRSHPLVCVSAVDLSAPELLDLAHTLGTPMRSPRLSFRLEGHAEIMRIGNVRDGEGHAGASAVRQGFHSDMAFRKHPAEFTMLYALEVPSSGGDTQFTSLYRLYEELDPATRETWEALEVEFESNSAYFVDDPDRRNVHRLIRRHPDSGRRLVFASPVYMKQVIGLTEAESAELVERIAQSLEPPDVSHRWRPGDLLVWDNRAVVHRATEFDPSERRSLWRVSVHLDH